MPELRIDHPPWLESAVDWSRAWRTDEHRVGLTVGLARENVARATGGPFGAAVFETGTGRLVAVGVNSVVRLQNSVLHGEMMALMMAQARRNSFTLAAPRAGHLVRAVPDVPGRRPVERGEARRLRRRAGGRGGPRVRRGPGLSRVLPVSPRPGIAIVRGVLREEARAVLGEYRAGGGSIYNG